MHLKSSQHIPYREGSGHHASPSESPRTSFRAPDLEEGIFSCHSIRGINSGVEDKVKDGGERRTFYADYDLYKLFRDTIFPGG
jgi:hypothetical protein